MKRNIIVLAVSLLATSFAGAQGFEDALIFSGRNYGGTARSIALGGAMTALGGDIGSLTFNPAGSAVASYSQFTITPALSFSGNTSAYDLGCGYVDYDTKSFGSNLVNKSNYTKFTLPNVGYMSSFSTNNLSGLKSVSFGVVLNSADFTLDRLRAGAASYNTSFMGDLAYDAGYYGYDPDILASEDSYYIQGAAAPSWNSIMAYRSGLIGFSNSQGNYLGSSEFVHDDGTVSIGGPLNQTYSRQQAGSRRDILINVGLNFSDKFYAGLNLGMPVINYRYKDIIEETPQDYTQFYLEFEEDVPAYFLGGKKESSYEASAEGIFAQLGFIWLPLDGLRLGGSIQTPTLLSLNESWYSTGSTSFTVDKYGLRETTPFAEDSYGLITPYKLSLGAAFTVPGVGLLSADWEMMDYATMRFYDEDGFYQTHDFSWANADIAEKGAKSHMLRLGAEAIVAPGFSLRGGYNLTTTPYSGIKGNMTHAVSLGFGYSSDDSFFADFALRKTFYPMSAYAPYANYIYGVDPDAGLEYATAFINAKHRLVNAVITLGWRF